MLDKKRMENGTFLGEDYFEHLIVEIREIRLSERRFYQKQPASYATSMDYNKYSRFCSAVGNINVILYKECYSPLLIGHLHLIFAS